MILEKTDIAAGPGAVAFSTLRGSGYRPGRPYSGFSACHYTGDTPEHVHECREALCRFLDIAPDRLIIPRQTHSARVAVISEIPATAEQSDGTDALVTRLRGVALCINTADCAPMVLNDPRAGVIGICHSGWRGTVARIAARTVESMVALGADPRRIVAAFGPMICRECFEVGEEVAERFDREFPDGGTVDRTRVKPRIDLLKALHITLTEVGVPAENIAPQSAGCPRCPGADSRYFSARRLGIESGRTLTVIIRD